MTVLYTSHYLEEVAELCDRVAIMDRGAIVAQGTLAELVARHGQPPRLELELAGGEAAMVAARARAARHGTLDGAGPLLRLPQPPSLGPLVADLESAGVTIVRITAQPTSLESVFLALTGHALRDE
jgi:ABC-type multidrug transport system ATPase subunit